MIPVPRIYYEFLVSIWGEENVRPFYHPRRI